MRFHELLKGFDQPCQFPRESRDPPEWLDRAKFLRGQQVYREYSLSILMSNIWCLVVGLVIPNLRDPLIITEKSGKPRLARLRYMHTLYYLQRWYKDIPWETPHAWDKINALHARVASQIKRLANDGDLNKRIQDLGERTQDHVSFTPHEDFLLQALERDLSILEHSYPNLVYKEYVGKEIYFSQWDMSIVQAAFFAMFVTVPHIFGASFISREDLEALAHCWRVTGYYLGIDDALNFASGDLESIRECWEDLMKFIIVPSMIEVKNVKRSLLMAKTLCQGFNMDLFVIWYRMCQGHNIQLHNVWKAFNWKQKLSYFVGDFVFHFVYAVPLFRRWLNTWMERLISRHLRDPESREKVSPSH